MARVQGIFEQADQKDADNKGIKKGGDNALELHEFLECVVMLAFFRANPRFGTVGREREVGEPLPGCLDTLLNQQDGYTEIAQRGNLLPDLFDH